MTELNIPDFIPRFSAGAGDGVNKLCAMQFISYINGDTQITDFPECSARPLARLVQGLNDRLAGADGFLSPENSVIVLDLGWLTVGTAGTPRTVTVVWRWLADLLVDPDMGVVRYARLDGVVAIRRVAALCVRESLGERVSRAEWSEADAYAYAAVDARVAAYAAAAARAAAYAAAYATVDAAVDAAAAADAYAAVDAAAAAAAYAAAAAAADAYAAADAAAYAAAYADARITFTRWAIQRWRDLAGLDTPTDIRAEDIDHALTRIAK